VLVSRDFERTAPWVLLSFVGLFGLGWMMVPDVPLFLGWTTAFVSVWRICFARERLRDGFFLGCAVALLMLSKYSGILAAFSGVLCILFWAPRCRKMKAMLWLGFGLIAGMLPTLVWNSQHEWASILYQIRDRHSGASLSMIRWIKFWLIELIFASPVVIGYFFVLCKKNLRMETNSVSQVERFLWVWIWPPAAIFCLQPFFSEFKPHWAFVVWWPVTLGLAVASGSYRKALTWAHLVYGGTLTFFIAFTCHWPWMAQVVPQLTHSPFQMTWDVTNDFYGWSQLKTKMSSSIDPGDLTLPVVGSRYQTASQAAFSLAGLSRVTLIPRDLKEKDEWPDLNISLPQALDWPQLDRAVLFVADNRYSEAPQFKNSRCALLEHFDIFRNGLLSKWIEVWKCFPNNPS
jgi:hypothetical protein